MPNDILCFKTSNSLNNPFRFDVYFERYVWPKPNCYYKSRVVLNVYRYNKRSVHRTEKKKSISAVYKIDN